MQTYDIITVPSYKKINIKTICDVCQREFDNCFHTPDGGDLLYSISVDCWANMSYNEAELDYEGRMKFGIDICIECFIAMFRRQMKMINEYGYADLLEIMGIEEAP